MALELSDSDLDLPDLSGALMLANKYQVHAISSDSDSDDLSLPPSLAARLNNKGSASEMNDVIPAKKARVPIGQPQNKEERKVGKQTLQKKKSEEEKSRLRREKQEKKDQQEYEKAKKRTLQQAARSAKPGECLKSMLVMISPEVIAPPMGNLLDALGKADIRYVVQSQVIENIVTFWREVTDVREDGRQLTTEQHEVVEKEILHFVSLSDFLSAVDQFHKQKRGDCVLDSDRNPTLKQLFNKVSQSLVGHLVVFVVMHLEKYFNQQKHSKQKELKKQISGKSAKNPGKISFADCPNVSRLQVEEALLALQMEEGGMVRCVESPEEASSLVKQFVKSVAEAPFKRDRLDGGLATFMDVSGSSKVTKEGRGLLSLWRQHIQQFRNVTAEVANAIIAEYPSPRDLYQAYLSCENQNKAEQLLQDIVVRRGAGVIATNRRIGKELSRKIYLLMTSCDPDLIIK